MLHGPLVFVDVDTQRDFLEPTGALFVPRSPEILPNLAKLSRFAREHGIPIVATACAHALDDPEPEPFPPHCLIGTHGQRRVDATAHPESVFVNRDTRGPETVVPHLTIEKRYYDVFTHPDAERLFSLYAQERPLFVVYGVATDYCVRADVLGLLDRGQRVAVVVDAIRAVDPEHEPDVIAEFIRGGALLAMTDVICAGGVTDWTRSV